MTTVYWTPEARARLKESQNYIISQEASKTAKEVVTALVSRTRQLATSIKALTELTLPPSSPGALHKFHFGTTSQSQ